MTTYLMVPIVLDALWLDKSRSVVEAMADFSKIPFTDGQSDHNSQIANISENLVSQPFENEYLHLNTGVHLHWALPDTLTHSKDNGERYPTVPNRWLVTRSRRNDKGTFAVEKRWVVESDYLYPDGEGEDGSGVSVPINPQEDKPHPFRFMGRKIPFEDWKENQEEERLTPLTAIGYGDPSFAAFYPNCASIFGFHDSESGNEVEGLRYDIIGWYSNINEDELHSFVESFASGDRDSLMSALEEEMEWTYISGEDEFPDRVLCYSRLTFEKSCAQEETDSSPITISVGNTGTEALAARLADMIGEQYPGADYASKLEDQLEAITLADSFQNLQSDLAARFKRARHEKEFDSIEGGALYRITSEKTEDREVENNADGAAAARTSRISLPDKIGEKLNQVNLLQRKYNRALAELESRRRQLYADWYKYMLCAYPPEESQDNYPDMDKVRNFIIEEGIDPLNDLTSATGELTLERDKEGRINSADAKGVLANELANLMNDILNDISLFNSDEECIQANINYLLIEAPTRTFYKPTDPVVLMDGSILQSTVRHGKDGILQCGILASGNDDLDKLPVSIDLLDETLDRIETDGLLSGIASWTGQPWNPFLLEWEAQLFPLKEKSNLGSQTRNYDSAFVEDNFIMLENEPDLSPAWGKGETVKGANIYRSVTLLSDAAGTVMQQRLESYLNQTILKDYCTEDEIPDNYLISHIEEITLWYEGTLIESTEEEKAADPVYTSLLALNILLEEETPFYSLSQSLGGFHEALLMAKQSLQVAVSDPIGFDEDQVFAQSLADAVGESIHDAPEPSNDFNPIRSGTLEISRLRIVDTFGLPHDIEFKSITPAHKMRVEGVNDQVALTPRLAQPSRLNALWLSALSGEEQLNSEPVCSPICGWFLTNHLDNSLMVYDSLGKALGSINRKCEWEGVPGDEPPLEEKGIPNKELQDKVGFIREKGVSFLENFIIALDTAASNIEPENAQQHQGISLLVGRPLALVRMTLDLELEGLPCVHQGWNAFRQDLEGQGRETAAFDDVNFPIRLGEYKQLNDGLAGYWIEAEEQQHFYTPQSDEITDETIITRSESNFNIFQSINSAPTTYTLLIDPRGKIHFTSGILPPAILQVPPAHYEKSIKSMEVSFLTAPILTQKNKLSIPLPDEAGLIWSWLGKETGTWKEVSTTGVVRKEDLSKSFESTRGDIWSDLLNQGWLVSEDGVSASVSGRDQRTEASWKELEKIYGEQLTDIEIYLDNSTIGKVSTIAEFQGVQTLKDGWLKLGST